MKKLIAILTISLFVLAGCQESSSLVAPESDSSLEKEKKENFAAPEQDDDGSQDSNGEPSFPRI